MRMQQTKYFLLVIYLLSVLDISAQSTDTLSVYFRLDISTLDKQAYLKIDSALYTEVIHQSQELLIIGYADYIGTDGYNDSLSAKRANNVKSYLQSMGISDKNISMCIGKGEVSRNIELPQGYASDRRVDIVPINKIVPKSIKAGKPTLVPMQSKDAIVFNADIPVDTALLKRGQLFVMNKIFFYTGRHLVVESSLPEIDRLVSVLQEHPNVHVRIEGHVCCVHPSTDALDEDTGEVALSVNRAKFIYSYLVKNGINGKRLSYQGFGKTRPLRLNEFTQKDQDMNKRVEVRVVKD